MINRTWSGSLGLDGIFSKTGKMTPGARGAIGCRNLESTHAVPGRRWMIVFWRRIADTTKLHWRNADELLASRCRKNFESPTLTDNKVVSRGK